MEDREKLEIVIISGMSGAGKTKAADWFEDKGYYCIDNMPPKLIRNFIELSALAQRELTKVAFVVDVRGGRFLEHLDTLIGELRNSDNINLKILFLDASDETLIKRYNETRRNHPLSTGSTSRDVIERERKILGFLKGNANFIIDTTALKMAAFYREMDRLFLKEEGGSSFSINIKSFGFKYGIPIESDLVFDVRFIPNPYYVPSLKKLTGNNKKVSQYVMKHKIAKDFIDKIIDVICTIAPGYAHEGKNHINLSIGCTGGQHRSVAIANALAEIFKEKGFIVVLEHREQD